MAGDVAMINPSNNGFVQIGWYLGAPDDLPQANTPRVFYGESLSPKTEQLYAGPGIGWGVRFSVQLLMTQDGYFDYYYNNVEIDESQFVHSLAHNARFVGEADRKTQKLTGQAYGSAGTESTLEYYNTSGWHLFGDHYYDDPPFMSSSFLGYAATDFVEGQGSGC